jgi:hypothetical protein
MNDEYLWNKTGDDPEIRNLEESLAVFRHLCDTAPALPTPIVEMNVSRPSWTLWLRFAFAASAAVVLAASVWMWGVQERDISEIRTIETATPVDTRPVAVLPTTTEKQEDDTAALDERKVDKVSFRSSNKPGGIATRRPKHRVQKTVTGTASNALTKEEKYAYDRLMLALSITSSKLKIVRDTIEGNDDSNRSDKR